jgi:O-antigen/teichoic acid export membrane protein
LGRILESDAAVVASGARDTESSTESAKRASAHGQVVRGSVWLIAGVAANAVGGFAFWLVAARHFSSSTVGTAAGLFTSVMVTNYATSLGLPVVVARYATDRSLDARRMFNWAVSFALVGSAIGAAIYLVAVPGRVADTLSAWGTAGAIGFLAAVAGMAFAVLVDIRLMTLRRWGWAVARASAVGLIRLPLLALNPIADEVLWVFLVAAGVPALSGVVGVVFLVGRRPEGHVTGWLVPVPPRWSAAVRFARVNYFSMLASQAAQFLLPLIVLLTVSSSANASFYVAFGIATIVFLVPQAIGQVLLVEGGKDNAHLGDQVRIGMLLSVAVMVLIAGGAFLFADLVPAIYGPDYRSAARVLPTLVVAGIPWAVTSICLARVRVEEDTVANVLITGTLAVTIVLPALILTASHGLTGAAVAWLLGNTITAVVALTATRWRTGVRRTL